MIGLKSVTGMCLYVALLAAWPASAKLTAAPAEKVLCPASVAVAAPVDGEVRVAAGSEHHLAMQYSLHRASRYLYNPVQGEWVARAADGHTVKQ